jgi:hypothetical protein
LNDNYIPPSSSQVSRLRQVAAEKVALERLAEDLRHQVSHAHHLHDDLICLEISNMFFLGWLAEDLRHQVSKRVA